MNTHTSTISDGYHTFDELYEHRHMLFLNLMALKPDNSWVSKLHDDGTSFDGWFIAGMITRHGTITYHIPDRLWDDITKHVRILERAPKWDGHTSTDVVNRLYKMLKEAK